MLYKLAHFLRDHCSFLWNWAEGLNSLLFKIRYGKKLKLLPQIMERYSNDSRVMRVASVGDADALASFFAKQPKADFEFFRPHGFDTKSLSVLLQRTSFQMFVVESFSEDSVDKQIVGYFFLRSFVHGQSYLGKMVDHNHQGQGIGKLMCKAAMDVALTVGMRMFESINRRNPASMRSTGSVLRQVVLQELEDGDLLIEDRPLSEE